MAEPPNHGQPWTREQDARLLFLMRLKLTINGIAGDMGRTEEAITLRLERLEQLKQPKPLIPPDRVDYLTTHYIWVIQNEAGWYHKAKEVYLPKGDFYNFRLHTSGFIDNIRRHQGDGLTGIEWAFIFLELWSGLGGDPNASVGPDGVATSMSPNYERLLESNLFKPAEPTPETQPESTFEPKENTMQVNTTTPVQVNTYVFGKDTDAMSDEDFINAIRTLEAQIGSLKTITAKSAKIKAKIAELQATLGQVVAIYDAK